MTRPQGPRGSQETRGEGTAPAYWPTMRRRAERNGDGRRAAAQRRQTVGWAARNASDASGDENS